MTVESAAAEIPNLPARKRAGVPREGEKRVVVSPNQETFLQAYLDCGKRAVAYRTAYKVLPEKDGEWVYVQAWKVMQLPKVRQRLAQIQAERAAAHIVNGQTLTAELEQARLIALELDEPRTAISATMGKARITGHLSSPEGALGANNSPGVNAGVNIQIVFNQTDANLL